MQHKDIIIAKYKEKIKKLSNELAIELLNNELDLEKKFITLDSDVKAILTEVGSTTMEIIGSNLETSVKKKPLNKG